MEDPTLTPDAVAYFTELAKDADEHLASLPESAQPFWYRNR